MSNRWTMKHPFGSCLLVVALAGLTTPVARAEGARLTRQAEAAVKGLFPDAAVIGVGRESENGVKFFEVVLRDGERKIEVEVTADGAIGEIESRVPLAKVPKAALEQIVRLTDGAPVDEVERIEVRGRAARGTFVAVDPPEIVYEVEYRKDGVLREIAVRENGKVLADDAEDDEDDGPEDDD